MPITYPLTFPDIHPNEFSWANEAAIAHQEAEFNYHGKTYAWEGQRRTCVFKFPALDLPKARIMQAFVRKLNYGEGTFYYTDPTAGVIRGTVPDEYANGKVMGASQTGSDLITDGWPLSQTVFRSGDFISIGDRLYEILDDANSDGAGVATLSLWPFIRTAYADNAVISVGSASRGIFRMIQSSDENRDVDWFMHNFQLSAIEDI